MLVRFGLFVVMKVLHVIPSVSPLRGGPSVMLRTMARGLVQAGVEVDVATTDDDGPKRRSVSYATPIVEEAVTYRYFTRQTRFYTFSWPLSRWLAQHVRDYDLVHIHAIFSYAAIPAAFCAKRYGVPYIVRPLGVLNRWGVKNRRPWLKQLSFRFIEHRILTGAAAIHYTSEQEQIEAEELGVKSRAVIIPNAVDDSLLSSFCPTGRFRAQYPQFADRLIILFLSRLDQKKGLDILFPAFARVKARFSQALLVIAGNGETAFIDGLQQEARRLGIDKDIVWAGFLSGEEKRHALADADIFALPSYSENFGIAVVEAMACGLPAVISDQVGIQREIATAEAGIVTQCEINEFAQALSLLTCDAKLRSRMAENGKRWVRQHCSSSAVTEKLLALYQQVSRSSCQEQLSPTVCES